MPLHFAQSEGINPITSSWRSREVKQIEAQKHPEMVYIIQQQPVSYVQFAKNNVYPLNDKLYSHLCQKKLKSDLSPYVCVSLLD